jgi:hypothetical protein
MLLCVTEKASADQLALQTRLEITTAHDIFDGHLRLGQTVRVSKTKPLYAYNKVNDFPHKEGDLLLL